MSVFCFLLHCTRNVNFCDKQTTWKGKTCRRFFNNELFVNFVFRVSFISFFVCIAQTNCSRYFHWKSSHPNGISHRSSKRMFQTFHFIEVPTNLNVAICPQWNNMTGWQMSQWIIYPKLRILYIFLLQKLFQWPMLPHQNEIIETIHGFREEEEKNELFFYVPCQYTRPQHKQVENWRTWLSKPILLLFIVYYDCFNVFPNDRMK